MFYDPLLKVSQGLSSTHNERRAFFIFSYRKNNKSCQYDCCLYIIIQNYINKKSLDISGCAFPWSHAAIFTPPQNRFITKTITIYFQLNTLAKLSR